MRIAAIHRYPVKSLGGQALAHVQVTARGIAGDRRWLVTDPHGRFVTRRELPAMALIAARPVERGIVLSHAGGEVLEVAEPAAGPASQPVTVWRDAMPGEPAGEEADAWLSRLLGRPLRLFHMADATCRPVDPAYGSKGDMVSFADGFPLLVTTTESLDALNARLESPVEMARFRPNIVIEAADAAFAEDGWSALRIGSLRLRVVKPCTRCVMTTQDPQTGESTGPEPMRTLRAMGRLWQRQPIFGQNAIPDGEGAIALGDAVELVD